MAFPSPVSSRRSVRDIVSSGWTSLKSPRLPFRRSQTLVQPPKEGSVNKRYSLSSTQSTTGVTWKTPSQQTREDIFNLFQHLFKSQLSRQKVVCGESVVNHGETIYGMDIHNIENTLAKCAPDEDILEIEDRDHYNLMQKAIIFNCPEAVTVLLNHGCSSSGVAAEHPVTCTVTNCSRCPHLDLQALHLAAFHGHISAVRILLARGADRYASGRVYTSAVLNDPYGLQPDVLKSLGHNARIADIMYKCGPREPVFYAVLGDHLDTLKVLMGEAGSNYLRPKHHSDYENSNGSEHETSHKHPTQYGHLVNLAARVGAYNCLDYLLKLYPTHVNVRDADGMPPMLMALNHSTRFVRLLLEAGADVHILDDFIEPGSNILHLLIKVLPLDACGDQSSLTPIVDGCLQQGVRVNAQRKPYNRTPLHDLLTVINMPISASTMETPSATPQPQSPQHKPTMCNGIITDKNSLDTNGMVQRCFDEELIRCVRLLIQYGADLNSEDSEGKTPLMILLSNGNHTLRCNLCFDYRVSMATQKTMVHRNFGLQNTIALTKILLEAGASLEPNSLSITPLHVFIDMICSSYFGSDFWAWTHSLEILEESAITDSYCELLDILLKNKCDPNITTNGSPPAMLHLLSHVAKSPYTEDYVVPLRTALAVQKLLHCFLQYDTQTEVTIMANPISIIQPQVDLYKHPTTYGCLDMLTSILRTMTTFKQSHTGEDLLVLKVLMLCLFQHGASSTIHPSSTFIPSSAICMGIVSKDKDLHFTETFLYQILLFGLLNLDCVSDGPWYKECVEVLYSECPHNLLQPVLELITDQLRVTHPSAVDGMPCSCGHCAIFHAFVHSMLNKPRRLKQICRLSVRYAVGGRLYTSASRLGLPQAMVHYLKTFVP